MTRKYVRHAGTAILVAALLLVAIAIVGPLTYDQEAHRTLDAAVREWSVWGDQVFGINITEPRQNLFSLAWDLHRPLAVFDHAKVHGSHLTGLINFVGRGSIYTVVDALRLFNVALTAKQAHALDLCKPLNDFRTRQPIVVQPDPWQYGIASWYGPGFDGRMAASGEIYHMYDMTAAHRTLPLQSIVRVVATRTNNSIIVRINDRGPYIAGRNIDLSRGAKDALGVGDLSSVYIERIDPTALDTQCD